MQPDKKAFRREYRFPLLLQCKQTEVSFHNLYSRPPSNAPHILPGNASGLPSPNKLRIKDAINACASAHQGPTVTAHKIFTICCTGAHFEPNTGKENKLPTTATAAKIAVTVNFFKLDFSFFRPHFRIASATFFHNQAENDCDHHIRQRISNRRIHLHQYADKSQIRPSHTIRLRH